MPLTKAERDRLPETDFAVPSKRVLLINDEQSTRLAWNNVPRVAGLTYTDRKAARERIIARAPQFNIDTSQWTKGEAHSARLWSPLSIAAAGIELAALNDNHPNKMPFSGILTQLDQPSNSPPKGSSGRRIQVSLEAAERALPSLINMAVNYKPDFTGHQPQLKIGVITAARIDGKAIRIEGFIYARDFPEAAAEIRRRKDDLGFSFEAADVYVTDPDADILEVQALTFTGAAILEKSLAAYRSTSLAAETADDDPPSEGFKMDDDVKTKFDTIEGNLTKLGTDLTAAIKGITDGLQAQSTGRIAAVTPLAEGLEAQAAKMEAAGVGTHPTHGHVRHLRTMASALRADAAAGTMPQRFDGISAEGDRTPPANAMETAITAAMKTVTDQLAAFGTQINDLKAAAAAGGVQPPPRKTVPPEVTALLSKHGIAAEADGKIQISKLDAALKTANITGGRAIELKGILAAAQLID